jgi:hypothetical protein
VRRTLAAALLLSSCTPLTGGGRDGGAPPERDAAGADAGADASAPDRGVEEDAGMADAETIPPCIEATGPGAPNTGVLEDGSDRATVTVTGSGCNRTYALASTAPLRDHPYANPRVFSDGADRPSIRTNHLLFDAAYALALEEVREASVAEIRDGGFRNGAPLACPTGGCFETGRLWTYVWTRDTAYSVDLALAAHDPLRAKNSLELKLSRRRDGTDLQIVQDTGTGGSHPVSTDRVVWALAAARLLEHLEGSDRDAFEAVAYEAVTNTIEHDRAVVFDPLGGLYRGESSFLDWREQSYAAWTATDVVHIGMSRALSTNVLHLRILEIGSGLAAKRGDGDRASRYGGYAASLKAAIRSRFLGPSGPHAFSPTELDPAPTGTRDLLATALAILAGVVEGEEAREALSTYPHSERGAPVIWPAQQDVPIYHNRAIWPFVTAYALLAAKKAGSDRVFDHGVRSLLRGAALNLSNMENLEMLSGRPFVDDGPASGPVVNSQRQLWSVAGYLAMVERGIFGADVEEGMLHVEPYVTEELRRTLFAGADTIVLNRHPIGDERVTVVLHLPPIDPVRLGALAIGAVRWNGAEVAGPIPVADLAMENRVDVELVRGSGSGAGIAMIGPASDYRNVFGPRPPIIGGVSDDGGRLRVEFSSTETGVSFDVFRDGVFAGSGPSPFLDTVGPDGASACYSVASRFDASGTPSQHARPSCWWGPGAERVRSVPASALRNTGGTYSTNHGRGHYEAWGDDGHTLELVAFTPSFTGPHLLQVVYGNGAGPTTTGITCAVKKIEVVEMGGAVVASGYLVMPHAGSWDEWRDSSFVRADLRADRTYRILISSDARSVNMSAFAHFADYTAGTGGSAPFNRANISELKVLSLTGN